MDYLLGKKFKKNKNTTSSSSSDKSSNKEDEKMKKQIEKEIKKQEKLTQNKKSENLKQLGGSHNNVSPAQLTLVKNYQREILEFNNSKNSSSMWAVDGMLIDEELLYAEDEEADRIYQELKARSFRRRKMEESENRLSNAMMHDQDIEEEEDERKEFIIIYSTFHSITFSWDEDLF